MKLKLACVLCMLRLFSITAQIDDCSECGRRVLTGKDLHDKSAEELALLRNEIFARKGHVFKTYTYESYFSLKSWYKPSDSDIVLNNFEMKNVKIIKKLENALLAKRSKAMRDLKSLKTALNSGDLKVIKRLIPKDNFDEYIDYENSLEELKGVLNLINLSDVHWNRKSGYYKSSIDNGYNVTSYSLLIDNKEIRIGGGLYSHSANFGDFEDGYSDYMSESENQTFWIFKITNSGISFHEVRILG